jgi:histidinol-phosphate aminotransferase
LQTQKIFQRTEKQLLQGLKMSNWPSWLPLRNQLRPLTPYGAPQVPAEARLNTNENPYGPSKELAAAIAKRVGEVASSLNRYPDRDAIKLREGLAAYLTKQTGTSLSVENIWAANGSNEILQSIFLAFGSNRALGFVPSYSMHPLIGKVANVEWVEGVRREDFTLDVAAAVKQIETEKPAITFITTPNNPTGSAISISDIEALAKATASIQGLLVVDEAYAEFSKELSAITLIQNYPNVLVSRTMSKAFAFAGVRLGYLAANKVVVDALQLVRLPYHLSAITQAAAEVALDFQDELLAEVSKLAADRDEIAKALSELGLKVIPSDANFILFGGFSQSSHELWEKLLAKGVLIRDVGLAGYLRVTIGNDAENQAFLKALKGAL